MTHQNWNDLKDWEQSVKDVAKLRFDYDVTSADLRATQIYKPSSSVSIDDVARDLYMSSEEYSIEDAEIALDRLIISYRSMDFGFKEPDYWAGLMERSVELFEITTKLFVASNDAQQARNEENV